jgi:hypothetical protein
MPFTENVIEINTTYGNPNIINNGTKNKNILAEISFSNTVGTLSQIVHLYKLANAIFENLNYEISVINVKICNLKKKSDIFENNVKDISEKYAEYWTTYGSALQNSQISADTGIDDTFSRKESGIHQYLTSENRPHFLSKRLINIQPVPNIPHGLPTTTQIRGSYRETLNKYSNPSLYTYELEIKHQIHHNESNIIYQEALYDGNLRRKRYQNERQKFLKKVHALEEAYGSSPTQLSPVKRAQIEHWKQRYHYNNYKL